MKAKHWYDYLWVYAIIYFALGFFNILFAWLGMIDFLLPLLLAIFGGFFRHWSRVTPYTSTCVFAECCVFDKQSVGPFLCGLHRCRHPFFRSYGANLPSSLTRFHSYALVYSTHPPVSVCGTGRLAYAGAFLGTRSNDALSPWTQLGIQ